jgi:hypothetical protein
MSLSGPQVKMLQSAIAGAYDLESFEQCLHFRLNIRLREIVAIGAFRDVIYSFIDKMEQQGRTAGVLQSLKDDRPGNLPLVAVCEELLTNVTVARVPADITGKSTTAPPDPQRPFFVTTASVERSKQKMGEIEIYLSRIAELLPEPDPDVGLLSVLRPILAADGDGPRSLRAAFGLPRDFQRSAQLYELIASDEPSMQPVLGVISQRMHMLMWRFGFTVTEIKDQWATRAKQTADAVSALCDQRLLARQPTLLDLSGTTDAASVLKAVGEPAPDLALYAALRAISHAENSDLPVGAPIVEGLRRKATDFLFAYLNDLLDDRRQVEDSSNVWWALRSGLCFRDDRFLGLLTRVSEKFNNVRITLENVSRLLAAPEIYKPIRTACYMLSNIQAIFELHDYIGEPDRQNLHQIILALVDRLLTAARSNQLYLASAHHEGLRNYIDYVRDQKLPLTLR